MAIQWHKEYVLCLVVFSCAVGYGNMNHPYTQVPSHVAMQSVLGGTRKMIYIEMPWSENMEVEPSGGVTENCMHLQDLFSNATSTYFKCIMCNARPLHYCEKCVSEFTDTINSYNAIVMDDENGTSCEDELLRADNVQVIYSVYEFALAIWDKSACHNCYKASIKNGTTVYNATGETKKMLKKIKDVQGCFSDFGDDTAENISVCNACGKFYSRANDYYQHLDDEGKLCSDLVDAMNYTRRMWSKDLHCTIAIHTDIVIYGMSVAIGFLPLIFYVSLYVHGKRLVRITTDRRRRTSSAAGLTDNADPLDIQASTSDAMSS